MAKRTSTWVKDINEMHEKFGVHEWLAFKQFDQEYEVLRQFLAFRINFLEEELNETREAFINKDAEEVIDLEEAETGLRIMGGESHGYGLIPAAIRWDTYKPRSGFWPKPSWNELVNLNEGVNLFHTEVKFNGRFQAFPALFSNAQIPDQTIGPDAIVTVETQPGEPVYLEYKSATAVSVSLKSFVDWLNGYQQDIAENWGVNLSAGGTGSADSGFKLVVQEIWNLETRLRRVKSAVSFEKNMHRVIKAISAKRNLGLGDGTLEVDFPEPNLPVNAKEEWDITKEKVAMSYTPVEEMWLRDNPDMTPEQIDERKALLGSGQPPDFSGAVDE